MIGPMAAGSSRTLHLLRHAKSSWSDPALTDRDRPLSRRGIRNAALLARELAETPIAPDLVLCSHARHTGGDRAGTPRAAETRFEECLYGVSAGALLAELRLVPDRYPVALLLGHNPGLEALGRSSTPSSFDNRSRPAPSSPSSSLVSGTRSVQARAASPPASSRAGPSPRS
jgi:phosphohistidine phosphatase